MTRAPSGALPIISADERMKLRQGIKAVLAGPSGVGKTSQLLTLEPASTCFIDIESGDLSVASFTGDTLRPRTWQDFRDLVAFIAGANPALRDDQPFSQAHFEAVCQKYGDPQMLEKYDTFFVDSITALARLCLQWAKGQPQAYSEKTGKPDIRGAYGLHGQEMIATLTHLQHARGKNVVFVAILEERTDDFNRQHYQLQIEGSKTGLELPGIVDQVITMVSLPDAEGNPQRAFVCQTLNPYGYPAKDRSGRLDMIEPAHLGQLFHRIRNRPATATTNNPKEA
ncbi:ATP-binding protein [Endozoicomonas atrinae]|uniref:ATP-binding protein n=1 Tax=Endozoicomonas atrinae TaxID=1333660 RepID=UPI0008243655|nr:ATP-binding protein [Endozoicomonas atrinae]